MYDNLNDQQKLGSKGENIWRKWVWNEHNDQEIYSTTYWRVLN